MKGIFDSLAMRTACSSALMAEPASPLKAWTVPTANCP